MKLVYQSSQLYPPKTKQNKKQKTNPWPSPSNNKKVLKSSCLKPPNYHLLTSLTSPPTKLSITLLCWLQTHKSCGSCNVLYSFLLQDVCTVFLNWNALFLDPSIRFLFSIISLKRPPIFLSYSSDFFTALNIIFGSTYVCWLSPNEMQTLHRLPLHLRQHPTYSVCSVNIYWENNWIDNDIW